MNLLQTAKKVASHNLVRRARQSLNRLAHYGQARFCPCCKASVRKFRPFGVHPREDAQCPVCGSLERHRLIWLYITQKTDLFDGREKKVLHVAPEPQINRLFTAEPYLDYLSGDLMSPDAMVKMDITDIQYPDNTFDVIYCSHVLEHVPDDRRAMREFHRVLKHDGWSILQVPITDAVTFEDPSVTSPEERERLFGQRDHVRRYGPDYKDRLIEAGFAVTVDEFEQTFDAADTKRLGLADAGDIYFCTKR